MTSVTDFLIAGSLYLHRVNGLIFYSLLLLKKLTTHRQGRKTYSLKGIQLKAIKYYKMIIGSNNVDIIELLNMESREYEKLNKLTDY